jgi:glucosamine-6-phosphate deaminase
VLGLPTGSTPIGVYRELIRLHREEGLDFSNVVTFNLDEYWPMDPRSIHSYRRWMRETFFDHVNVPEENIHVPDGTVRREDAEACCDAYEAAIEKAGGIDLMLLGIGRTGHVGFNEPGSSRNSVTRLVTLDQATRIDAASDFFGEENVPQQALTMGVGTILAARRIIIMALGEHKAPIVRRAVEGQVDDQVPASFLQTNAKAVFALDAAAAGDLTAVRTPWLVGSVHWTPAMEKRALIWLSGQVKKPLLKLESRDFLDHHLSDLARESGPVSAIRQRVYDELREGLCTQPAGDSPRRILVFSPHPDDDVISMGGTLITLADQGHEVWVAYMTSGNIAVFDDDALRHIDFVQEILRLHLPDSGETQATLTRLRHAVSGKRPGTPDCPEILDVKRLIRQTEAVAGARAAGVPAERLRFLDLPFYRTGEVTKRPVGDEDVRIVADLLREVDPFQIYVAGDLSDPHGTHRMCAQAVIRSLKCVEPDGVKPEVWLYRGAWQEYEPHEIERAVPLAPEVLYRKRTAIFKHESQKDRALFPGNDEREFWIRAEERTKRTARIYDELGLPEFFALEGFVRFRGQLL